MFCFYEQEKKINEEFHNFLFWEIMSLFFWLRSDSEIWKNSALQGVNKEASITLLDGQILPFTV